MICPSPGKICRLSGSGVWVGSRSFALDPILAKVALAGFERQPTHLEDANGPSGRSTLVEYPPPPFFCQKYYSRRYHIVTDDLRAARRDKSWTQNTLADQVRTSTQSIVQLEKGVRLVLIAAFGFAVCGTTARISASNVKNTNQKMHAANGPFRRDLYIWNVYYINLDQNIFVSLSNAICYFVK